MGGKSKKKSVGKKPAVQNPPKYVVAPVSSVKTRSSAANSQPLSAAAASAGAASAEVPVAILSTLTQAAEGAVASPYHTSLEDLGARMSQMESAVRSVLTAVSTSTPPAIPAIPTTDSPPPVAAAEGCSTEHPPRSRRRGRHRSVSEDLPTDHSRRRRHRARKSVSSSSSSSNSSPGSSSSRSSSSSTSSVRSSHRSSRHSRRKQERRDKKRKGKFDTSKYLREGDKLNTYERLVLANLKMVRKFYKKERYFGVLGSYDFGG